MNPQEIVEMLKTLGKQAREIQIRHRGLDIIVSAYVPSNKVPRDWRVVWDGDLRFNRVRYVRIQRRYPNDNQHHDKCCCHTCQGC